MAIYEHPPQLDDEIQRQHLHVEPQQIRQEAMVAEPATTQLDFKFLVPVLTFATLDVIVVKTFGHDQRTGSVADDGSPLCASGVGFRCDDDAAGTRP